MPRGTNQTPAELRYHVIFDTNGILSVKWSDSTISDFKNDFQGDTRLNLELIAFKPVFEEWRKHFIKVVTEMLGKHKQRAKSLSKYLGIEMPLTEVGASDIEQKSDEYINRMGLKVVEPDVSNFPTLDFFSRANMGQPPFENQDKGFRDSVIATATIAHIKANTNEHHLIVCNDKALSTYIEEQLQGITNFKVVPSLDEAGSQLNLALANLDEQLGDKAKARFADFSKDTGVYFDLGVEEKLKEAYESEYPTADAVKEYEKQFREKSNFILPSTPNARWKAGNVTVKVIETTFVRRQGNKLYWESDVGYSTTYTLDSSTANSIITSPGNVEHNVVYAVSWFTEQSGDDYFLNPEIGEVEKIDDVPRYYPTDMFYDSMSRLATLSGTNASLAGGINSGPQTYRWPPPENGNLEALNTLLGLNYSDNGISINGGCGGPIILDSIVYNSS